jgi:V/A-type H+-transporting ATPase subunit I
MSLRPIPARWFELLTDREELPRVLECLAATGGVELQRHSNGSERLDPWSNASRRSTAKPQTSKH